MSVKVHMPNREVEIMETKDIEGKSGNVKLPDGTMVCYGTDYYISEATYGIIDIKYESFISPPSLSLVCSGDTGSGDYAMYQWRINNILRDYAQIAMSHPSLPTTGLKFRASWIAIGRWK